MGDYAILIAATFDLNSFFVTKAWCLPKCQDDEYDFIHRVDFQKIGLKFKVLKQKMTEVAICCTTPLSCLTCKLPGIESASTAELHITLKKYYLYIYMKPFVSAE